MISSIKPNPNGWAARHWKAILIAYIVAMVTVTATLQALEALGKLH